MDMDMQGLFEKIQHLQKSMEEQKEKLKDEIVSSEAGGGMVKVTMSCDKQLKSLDIDDALLKGDEKEMLEDLIIAATNKALKDADKKAEEVMGELKGGLPHIPGLNFGQ